MGTRLAKWLLTGASLVMSQAPALAVDFSIADESWYDSWVAHKKAMAGAGLLLDFEWSQAYQTMLAGEGDHDSAYGGKLDVQATVDLSKFGFWDGFSVSAQYMYNYGDFLNGVGGVLTPIYDGAIYPGEEGADRSDLMALYFTQKFGDSVVLNVGKLNLMEQARGYPLRGGGGIDAFWNVNLSTTITGLAKPAIFGAQLSIATDPINYGLSVFDARDAMNRDVLDDPFSEGVTVMATATYKTSIAGHAGFYGIRGIYSDKEGFDLSDLDQIGVPPEARDLNTKKGSWLFSAQFEQYIVGGEGGSPAGWGVFSELVLTDGNPQAFEWSFQLGLAGSGLFESRPDDRFGIAAFAFGLSENIKDNIPGFTDEIGAEIFYNWAVTDWMRFTADLQYIDGGRSGEDAIFAGFGTNVRF